MARVGYRVPELGERVQMGKFATAFRGVWGQVIDVKFKEAEIIKRGPFTFSDGRDETRVYILTDQGFPRYKGRRVVIEASPYELDGGLLDERPAIPDSQSVIHRKGRR